MQKVASLLKNSRGLTGWPFVEYHMERQLDAGKTTPQDWADELSGLPYQAWVLAKPEDPTSKLLPICTVNPSKEFSPLETNPGRTKTPVLYERPRRMESWNFYLWWKDERVGEEIPDWVKAIRSDDEFVAFCLSAYVAMAALAMRPFTVAPEVVT